MKLITRWTIEFGLALCVLCGAVYAVILAWTTPMLATSFLGEDKHASFQFGAHLVTELSRLIVLPMVLPLAVGSAAVALFIVTVWPGRSERFAVVSGGGLGAIIGVVCSGSLAVQGLGDTPGSWSLLWEVAALGAPTSTLVVALYALFRVTHLRRETGSPV